MKTIFTHAKNSLTINKSLRTAAMIFIISTLMACQGETTAQTLDESKYELVKEPISVSTGDKIEVTELFWFGCGHCFALEPSLKSWQKDIPENAELVKVPAIFSKRWEFHAQAFYTMQALGLSDEANDKFFRYIHVQRKSIDNLEKLVKFLADFDKTEEQVTAAFNSFEVDTKLRNARKITRASGANGVPAMLVDGKYRTSQSMSGSNDEMFEVVNQLIDKAAAER